MAERIFYTKCRGAIEWASRRDSPYAFSVRFTRLSLDDDYVVEKLRPGVAEYCVATLRRDRRRRGCDKDTRDRAEAYNCRRTELDSKATVRHKDTAGRYYNNVQVSCRHLKGPRCFSRGTAIFGRFVRGKRYIHPHGERKMTFSSASAPLRCVVFDPREKIPTNAHEGGILQKMPS